MMVPTKCIVEPEEEPRVDGGLKRINNIFASSEGIEDDADD
jgi:hypothetical protein